MNKAVEKFLERQDKIITADREQTLIALGLTEKEYSQEQFTSFNYYKFENVNGKKQYYREVPIQVSDEEWEQIVLKMQQVEEIERRNKKKKEVTQVIHQKNTIASVLRVIAWVISIATILSGVVTTSATEDFFPILITVGIGTLVVVMFYALAAILDYLAELTAIARKGK